MSLYKDKIVVEGDFPTVVPTLLQQTLLHLLCCFSYPNPNINPLFNKFIRVVMNNLEYKYYKVDTNSS